MADSSRGFKHNHHEPIRFVEQLHATTLFCVTIWLQKMKYFFKLCLLQMLRKKIVDL